MDVWGIDYIILLLYYKRKFKNDCVWGRENDAHEIELGKDV